MMHDMRPLITVAIFSGEVESRISYLIKSINSINMQTYSNLQKILVNGGNPPHQTARLIDLGIDLSEWVIIDFPIDTMKGTTQISHKYTGQAALLAARGEYFFSMNDDDFLANDFFTKIVRLFEKYPSAIAGIGLPILFNHETQEFGKIRQPKDKFGNTRPEFESGLDVVRKIFFENHTGYQMNIGFQPIIRTEYAKEVAETLFYDGGFPDTSVYFQVIVRGDFVYDASAKMFWGKHSGQSNLKASIRHYYQLLYKYEFMLFSKTNCRVYSIFFPGDKKILRLIKNYFNQNLIYSSLLCINSFFSISSILKGKGRQRNPYKSTSDFNSIKFPLFKHILIIFSHPFQIYKVFTKTKNID